MRVPRRRRRMNPKAAIILATLVVLGMAAVFIVVSVAHLIKPAISLKDYMVGSYRRGDKVKGNVHTATGEFYSIEHTINHVIPIGTEHFFLIFNEDKSSGWVVRAPKDFRENFGKGGESKEGVTIEGYVRDTNDEISRRTYNMMVGFNGSYRPEDWYLVINNIDYIDLMGTRIYTMMLIDGVLLAACYFWVFFILKYKDRDQKDVVKMSKLHGAALAVTMLAALVMMIYIFSFI